MPGFLDDFQRHWSTDDDHTYVDFVRDGDQHDAYSIAAWLSRRSQRRRYRIPEPDLTPPERTIARVELES